MKIKKQYIKQILIVLISVLFGCNLIMIKPVSASTISDKTYSEVSTYNEIYSRILGESNKQALDFFNIIAKWDTYGATEQQQFEDLSNYIKKTKEQYSFIKDYNGTLAKEIQKSYENYLFIMDSELNKNVKTFINGKVIFVDFLESDIKETHNNFVSFKKQSLNKFLNSYIYTNSNKLALNKILNGSSSDKKEGINSIQETIKKLEELETKKITVEKEKDGKKIKVEEYAAPYIIRNYAKTYKDYYKNVINGDFSQSKKFLLFDKYRVESLIPVGNAFDEYSEFNMYSTIFSNFTDYTTLDMALSLSTKKIEETVKLIQKQDVQTSKIQELKKLHYEFIYALNDYKKSQNKDEIFTAFDNFNKKFIYLKSYYTRIGQRFGNFSGQIASQDISLFKEQAKCINPNIDEINELTYTNSFSKDASSYRQFLLNNNKYLKISLITAIIIFIILISIFFIRKNKNSNRYRNDDYYNNDYYNNNNNYYNDNDYDDYY